ncbi:hypothetical protein SBV1_1270019 [Verrucomicrobia bacterium]|nr:hypothetical protein SBV1_1270019 [Verrucomicrobiota bacterium]
MVMESPLSLLRVHWDHEPERGRGVDCKLKIENRTDPSPRPTPTLSPSEGAREKRFAGAVAGGSAQATTVRVACRLEIGDTAGRKPVENLRYGSALGSWRGGVPPRAASRFMREHRANSI